MSHTSTVHSIKIQSITALRAAIDELCRMGTQCSLVENSTPRAFYPNQQGMGLADFVVRLETCPYDIGLYKNSDGVYEARTDFWGGHVEKVLGAPASKPETAAQAKMGKLFQAYGTHAAMEAARRKGHMVRRIDMPNGRVKLEVTGANL